MVAAKRENVFLALILLALATGTMSCSEGNECDFRIVNETVIELRMLDNDAVISNPITSAVTGQPVVHLVTNYNCSFVENQSRSDSCGEQFYFNGLRSQNRSNRVAARVFQTMDDLEYYQGRCIELLITNAIISTGRRNEFEYLNPNDGNPRYPMDRRCVKFSTVPGEKEREEDDGGYGDESYGT